MTLFELFDDFDDHTRLGPPDDPTLCVCACW